MSKLSSQVRVPYKRRHFLVDRTLQLRFMLVLAGVGLGLVLLAGVLMFFWSRYLLEKALYSPHISHVGSGELLLPSLLGLNLVFAGLLIVVIIFLSRRHLQKITGSLLRLKAHLLQMGQNAVPGSLAFRNNDPLQPVGEAFNVFASTIDQRREQVRQEVRKAVAGLQEVGDNSSEKSASEVELKNVISVLKKARNTLDYK